MPVIFILAAALSTLVGGLFALRFRDRLHLILGFSAGAVIGVAFFELLPEAIHLGEEIYGVSTMTSLVALGFIVYMILDRFFFFHTHAPDSHEDEHDHTHRHGTKGTLGAGSLSIHSFLDGVAIGLAFQISSAVGVVVAIAVLVHDFSDGVNTVGMILKGGGSKRQAFKWLLIDAAAPVLGAASTLFITLPESGLGIILALFAGFFLYIGASDLLPESHHSHPTKLTTLMTVFGVLVLYGAIQLAGH